MRQLKTCGPALVLVFVVGPVYWLTFLRRQQGARQAGPVRFLTGSYRAGFYWWEAGRLCKTMLVASVVTASPTSYCPLQQLMLCLLITVVFGFWHCQSSPYKYFVLNTAEACALLTLSVGMVLSGLLAGGTWELTPAYRSGVVIGIAAVLTLYILGLAALWLKIKFFWSEEADEAPPAETSGDDGQRDAPRARSSSALVSASLRRCRATGPTADSEWRPCLPGGVTILRRVPVRTRGPDPAPQHVCAGA